MQPIEELDLEAMADCARIHGDAVEQASAAAEPGASTLDINTYLPEGFSFIDCLAAAGLDTPQSVTATVTDIGTGTGAAVTELAYTGANSALVAIIAVTVILIGILIMTAARRFT